MNKHSNIEYKALTQVEKNANDYEYYKRKADLLDTQGRANSTLLNIDGISDYKRMKVNYDLFNNIIDKKDFEYVCKPFGAIDGELPANMMNRDIISGKLKVLLGMEMKMPFSWKVYATNEEATTRKEQTEFGMIRDFVVNSIIGPIKSQIALEKEQQYQGQQLTPEQQAQIQQEIEQELQTRTPDEVRRYMVREHQDPAEALSHQLLEYISQKEELKTKFNKIFKHGILSGKEVGLVTILNGEPVYRVVNSLYFNCDISHDTENIEDGEWASCEYRMTPAEVISLFSSELEKSDIERIYDRFASNRDGTSAYGMVDETFNFDGIELVEGNTIRVLHTTWKDLKKIGFVTYFDEGGNVQEEIVDEYYKFQKGRDIHIEWNWIPEAHECWKILDDIYVVKRPVPGQFTDLENLYECKLPYYGSFHDSLNSSVTAAADRVKAYQYFYNVIMFRMEMALASDKGKKLLMNLNAIPTTNGFNMEKFLYYLDALGIGFLNPNEEGNQMAGDVTNMVKEIDMSFIGQLQHYINIAEYVDRKAGEAIGVTKAMEGQISPTDAVTNTQQNMVQASYIIQPYFDTHNRVKKNSLTALLKMCKVAYSSGKQKKLGYILDDMSYRTLTVDQGLLDSSTLGLFVLDGSKAKEAKDAAMNLAHAAMQTQQADLADVMKIVRSESIVEAEELLEAAKTRNAEEQQAIERYKQEMAAKLAEEQRNWDREKLNTEHNNKMAEIREKGEEDRKTAAVTALGFDTDKDRNNNNVPDVLEVANQLNGQAIANREITLKEMQFEEDKKNEKERLEIERLKAANKKSSK